MLAGVFTLLLGGPADFAPRRFVEPRRSSRFAFASGGGKARLYDQHE
jgi:hypothetical protein